MSVKDGQDRLLRIAEQLQQQSDNEEILWLADALRAIAGGGKADAALILGVKAKRGERTSRNDSKKKGSAIS